MAVSENDYTILEKDYQTYLEHRKICFATRNKNIESQDKIIITVSSALFGILLTIFDKNMIADNECARMLLAVLLISNTLTLLLALLSFSCANKAINKKIKIAESYLLRKGKRETQNGWEFVTKCLNCACVATTCITVLSLAMMIYTIL